MNRYRHALRIGLAGLFACVAFASQDPTISKTAQHVCFYLVIFGGASGLYKAEPKNPTTSISIEAKQ